MDKSLELSLYAIPVVFLCFFGFAESQIRVDGPLSFGLTTSEVGKNSVTTRQMNDGFVNLTTGMPQYSVPLYRLYSKSKEYYYDLELKYFGNIKNQINIPNQFADVSSVGFGWNCGGISYIQVDHKGTRSPNDDSYYFVFSDGSTSEMLKNSNTSFKLKADRRWEITAELDNFSPVTKDNPDDIWSNGEDWKYGYKTFTILREDGCYYTYARQMYYIAPYRAKAGQIEEESPFKNFGLDDRGVNAKFYYLFTLLKIKSPAVSAKGWSAKEIFSFSYHTENHSGTYNGHNSEGMQWKYNFTYPISYLGTWIENETLDGICFEWFPKDVNEGPSGNVDYRVTHPFPFQNYQKNYISDIYYGGDYNSKSGQLDRLRDCVHFTYTGQSGQPNSLNNGVKGNEKRLLTAIKRISCPEVGFSQGGENEPLCVLKYNFEYDFASYNGMLKSISLPDIGQTNTFDYTVKSVGGKEFWVVNSVRQNGGVANVSDFLTTYNYSTNTGEFVLKSKDQQYVRYSVEYDEESEKFVIYPDYLSPSLNFDRSMIYWGNVSKTNTVGSTHYTLCLNDIRNLGAITDETVKDINNNAVSSVHNEYTYSNSSEQMYLSSINKKEYNVQMLSGTSLQPIHNYMWDRYYYTKNSNNLTKVVVRNNPIANRRVTNICFGLGGEVVYSVNNYVVDMDLRTDDVVKAKYIEWTDFPIGMNNFNHLKPLNTYVWNSGKENGQFVTPFQQFILNDPTANARNGWVLVASNSNCTEWGSICESKTFKSQNSTSDFLCTSIFYSSDYGNIIAEVKNAELKECAILNGNNVSPSLWLSFFESYGLKDFADGSADFYSWKNDFWGNIKNAGTRINNICEIQNYVPHFSEKSIHVYKSYGPNTEISKVDPKIGHVFCAWVLPVDYPMRLAVEVRKKSDNSKVCIFDDLVTGLTLGKWQKIKKVISAEDLKKNGIENGDLYYFRIWIGNYPSDVNPAEFYVDDIRFYPKDALVKTFYYEMDNGYIKPTVTIDENENPGHVVFYDEIGRPREWNKIILNGNVTEKVELVKTQSYKTQGLEIKRRDLVGTTSPLIGIVYDLKTLWVYGTYSIEWFLKDVTVNVKIEYTRDGGTTWNTIVSSTESDGVYRWFLPGNLQVSDRCKIRITDVGNPAITIESLNEFSIKKARRFIRIHGYK